MSEPKRDQMIRFMMTPDEVDRMHQKMEQLGVKNASAYLRKMALDGYCINLDMGDIKELIYQVQRIGNNLNQYAKRANETGSIYAADIEDLKKSFDEIVRQEKEIAGRLSTIW